MPVADSPAVLVARFLKANNYGDVSTFEYIPDVVLTDLDDICSRHLILLLQRLDYRLMRVQPRGET